MTSRTLAEEALLCRGVNLERSTLAWNVVDIVVLSLAAVAARSVALVCSEIWSVHIGNALGIDIDHVKAVVGRAIDGSHASLSI